jgi:uncharacterized protein (DUF1697 family)
VSRYVVLLRGINVGANNRIAMADLRDLLADAGCAEVRTHLQSGNVLLTSDARAPAVAERVSAAIAERLGLQIDCQSTSQPVPPCATSTRSAVWRSWCRRAPPRSGG